MAKVQQDIVDLLHEKITISIEPNEYQKTYQQALKNAAKNVAVPGFRKGNAPVGMIEKMYGGSIFLEEAMKLAETQLFDHLKTNKLDILYQPLLADSNLYQQKPNTTETLQFIFEVGINQSIDMSVLNKIKTDLYHIAVTQDMVNQDVEYYQNHFANHLSIDVLSNQQRDYLVGEISAVNAEPDAKIDPQTFNLFTDNLTPEGYKKYAGIKKGDTIRFVLSDLKEDMKQKYESGLPVSANHEPNQEYQFVIEELKTTTPHELNIELYKLTMGDKTTISNEDEFKAEITRSLSQTMDFKTKEHAIHLLSHEVMDHFDFQLPKTFIKKWVESQKAKDAKAEQTTITEQELQDICKYIKQNLVHRKIIEQEKITANAREIEMGMKHKIMNQYGQFIRDEKYLSSIIQKFMQDKKFTDDIEQEILTSKVYDYIFSKVEKTTKDISVEEFKALIEKHNQEHHQHDH